MSTMQPIECQPEFPRYTIEFWGPLFISLAGIPLCIAFANDSIKRYARIMFPSSKYMTEQAWDRSKRQENGSGSSSSEGNHTMRLSASDTERNIPQPRIGSTSGQSTGIPIRHSIMSFMMASKQACARLRPKTTNQLLVTTSMLCWITMSIDQLFVVGQNVSISVMCPEWACRNATPTVTPGCPASGFVRSLPVLNSLGLFFYAYGAIHRFGRVYSTMSPTRHLISRICSAILVLLLVVRLSSVFMLSYVRFIPVSNMVVARDDRVISQLAAPVYMGIYSVFFSAILVIDVVCTIISVHFVIDCRARLRALVLESAKVANASDKVAGAGSPVIVGTVTDGEQDSKVPISSANDSRRNHSNTRRASCAIAMPAAQALMPMGSTNCGDMPQQPQLHAQIFQHRLSIASSALPIVSMPRSTGGSFSSGILAAPSLKRAASSTRMKAIVSHIALLTAIKFAFFGIFALVRLTPLVEGKVSVRVVDSFLLLTLKLVVAAATVGMTLVTSLVALRN